MVGQTTPDGVKIESYATHFVDRVIGQTAESHEGMRQGVPIESVQDALQSEDTTTRTMADGDVRRTCRGTTTNVTISVRDHRLIQTNPRGGKK